MNKKIVVPVMVILALVAVAVVLSRGSRAPVRLTATAETPMPADHSVHTPQVRIPAHFTSIDAAKPLALTLPPEQFFGRAREAYRVAREIPETLAQLPCFCYCDQSVGHKSLHTCYETDHSSMCAVCVDEALMAYDMQKKQGLKPAEIREKIIEKYSKGN